jgi:3-keto-disaccharide hydrolase
MTTNARHLLVFLALCISCTTVLAASPADPYLGRWALTIPGGGAGWLGVEQKDGYLDASILWGGGSVVPVDSVFVIEDELYVVRLHKVDRKNAAGEVVRTQTFPEVLRADIQGDMLELTRTQIRRNGIDYDEQEFTGKRIPPLPPAPDLSSVKRGKPVALFDGTTLDKWKLVNPDNTNAWTIEDGTLVNKVVPRRGSPPVHYGNLRTVDEFEDLNLKLEVKVDRRQNSGVYLRGIYEVQVTDSYGRNLDSHNMGAVYSRITPTVAAEKPAGQWQTMDITLCDRHVTVILNGKTIIDNQPLLGCTGGALTSDEFKPGPIYLQGDHTAVSYRNIVLTPITK